MPNGSKHLDYPIRTGWEAWRLKLDSWRVVYVIDRDLSRIYVVSVRKRPPYRYEDLDDLVAQVG